MKKKPQDTTAIANTALADLIDYANNEKNVGTKKALAESLSARLGYKVHRQLVEGWLNPDPEKRIEPKLGLGLVIMDEGEKIVTGKTLVIEVPKIIAKAMRNGHGAKKTKKAKQGPKKARKKAARKPKPVEQTFNGPND